MVTPLSIASSFRWLLVGFFVYLANRSTCHVIIGSSSDLTPTCSDTLLEKFAVYWNVPTDECLKHDISFDNLRDKFCIIQNTDDQFRGENIAILYDPGSFPTLKNDYDEDMERNGGVPQSGNLTLHLEAFQRSVDRWIPDANFSGLAVIDFELWHPIYRQLWGKYEIYKKLSVRIERQRHLGWNDRRINEEASSSFEKAARHFVAGTLEFAQTIRPRASWGYYDYPFCNNWASGNKHDRCPDTIVKENDQLSWLYKNINLLMPSVYLNPELSDNQKVGLVRGRVKEAVRLANKWSGRENVKILPYYWYRYRQNNTFVEKTVLESVLNEIAINGGDGVIFWGKRDDIDTRSKCEDFLAYVTEILGPTVLNIKTEN